MRTIEGAGTPPHDAGGANTAAPIYQPPENPELALAQLLRISPGAAAGDGDVFARAMFVAMLGGVIALVVLAIGSLV